MPKHNPTCAGRHSVFPARAMSSGLLLVLFVAAVVGAQTPGPNRNVVSGVVRPLNPSDPAAAVRTDILRQRQNEPVLAPSSLNPEHLLAAANDYRTIDIAGDVGTGESSDGFVARLLARLVSLVKHALGHAPRRPVPVAAAEAWMGVYRSCDRGRSWGGSLLPGSPSDSSAASLASPLRGLEAATDPVLAPAPGGRVFLGGLAFTRGGSSAVFVARYTDRNDREGGACFTYEHTRVVETGTVSDTGRFADKPTIVADVTRTGAGWTKRYVYVAYTVFTGVQQGLQFRGRIRFSRSADDGLTWTKPVTISGNYIHNQGASLAVDPSSGHLYVVWRDFVANQILMTRSADFGETFATPFAVHPGSIAAFDQVTGPDRFRSNGFPTIAVDGAGRVLLAWQERVNPSGEPDLAGSPRIVLTRSVQITQDAIRWTSRRAVDIADRYEEAVQRGLGTVVRRPSGPQVMPILAASAGRLMLMFSEGRGPLLEGRDLGMDVRVAEIDPVNGGLFPGRPSVQISEYAVQASFPPELVQTAPGFPARHRPNLPMFRGGTVPFVGDYHQIAPAQPFVSDAGGAWKWASAPGDLVDPTFHVVWTDNRNVLFPGDDIDGDWARYSPPGRGLSCVNPGSRDQDVYTSEVGGGIVAGTTSLFKPLLRPSGQPIPRAFVFYVENRTAGSRLVNLDLVAEDASTSASFDQFDHARTSLPGPGDEVDAMEILPFSTLTRTAYLESTRSDGWATVEVRDHETGVLLARVALNQGRSPFALTNTGIADSEVHTPRISNPRISNPRISNPGVSSPRISNSTVSNPRISNPRISNTSLSDDFEDAWDVTFTVTNEGNTTTAYDLLTFIPREYVESPKYAFQLFVYRTVSSVGTEILGPEACEAVEVLHDEFISSIESPRISNPRISNPDLESPRISNPRISNATFSLEPSEGPQEEPARGGDAAILGAHATSSGFQAAAATGDASAPLPAPEVQWTLRVFVLEPLDAGDPPLEALVPTDGSLPLVSAAVVSQTTNVVDGVSEEDPPYALVGPTPPEPLRETDGALEPFNSPPEPAAALAFSVQPGAAQAGQTLVPAPEVRVTDATGLTVPLTGAAVTLALSPAPGGFSGTATRLTENGVAAFNGLAVGAAGEGYTLVASAPGLASATSLPFDVTVDPPAVPPLTARLSEGSAGGEGTGAGVGCSGGRITPDGRFAAFDCTFPDLVPGDANGAADVLVRDRLEGTTTRVSVTSGGGEANGPSSVASLSDDGRFVAFHSEAANLDPDRPDTNGVADVFLHDRDADGNGVYDETFAGARRTVRVSAGPAGEGNGPSTLPVISGDGGSVAFWSWATNLVAGDTNAQPDVLVWSRDTGAIIRASVKSGGGQASEVESTAGLSAPAISADGSVVAFASTRSDLAPNDGNGSRDVYVHDRASVETRRVSLAADGKDGLLPSGCGPVTTPEGKHSCSVLASGRPSLSADGRLVAFDSLFFNLVPGDTNYGSGRLGRDVFVRDRLTGETRRSSVSSAGVQDGSPVGALACATSPSGAALSPDGRFVGFTSCASSLVAGDANGLRDAFLHDRLLATTVRTSVASGGVEAGTVLGASGATATALSLGARLVVFASDVETLIPGDTNRRPATGELGSDVFGHEPIAAPAPAGGRALAFVVPPTDTPAGEAISPPVSVELQDELGNTDPTATGLVSLSVETGPGALLGTTTVSAVAGVAVFPGLSVSEPGEHSLRARSPGSPDAVSDVFVVGPPLAVRLAFLTQPTATVATSPLVPAVQVAAQGEGGATATAWTGTVTLALSGGPGALSGTTSAAAVAGVATFAGLSVDVVASGYTLVATAAGLEPATSTAFDVAPSTSPLSFTVGTTADSGPGSLRQALLAANANAGTLDIVGFAIPGTPPHSIALATPLPAVADPVLIDATTQSGYAGAPLVEIDGRAVTGALAGLWVEPGGSGSTIRGLSIHGFVSGSGIHLGEPGHNIVEACWLGLDAAGAASANQHGLRIADGSDQNRIGGSSAGAGNVVGGNAYSGILISGGSANVVSGNLIGTDPSGLSARPNPRGVLIQQTSALAPALGNVIGGSSPDQRNVISGNTGAGVMVWSAYDLAPSATLIRGNMVGLDVSGAAALGNGTGLWVAGTDTAIHSNVVSGNDVGIRLTGSANGAVVQGNRVGTNAAGDAALPNVQGIYVWGDSVSSALIGGAVPVEGNLVSGNTSEGILVQQASGVRIQGNRIGTDASGTRSLGGQVWGVRLVDGAHDVTVGGASPGAGNLLSGHTYAGVGLDNDTFNCLVIGNRIGTDAGGTSAVPNTYAGVYVASRANGHWIGSGAPGAGNLISGNGSGVQIVGSASGTRIAGNLIGTTADGLAKIPNEYGVLVSTAPLANTIGGGAPGEGNVISGNSLHGVLLSDSSNQLLLGNLIGTDVTGIRGLGNSLSGVSINQGGNHVVGGGGAGEGNVVSGNEWWGVYIGSSSGNRLMGNQIGTDTSGTQAVGNGWSGVYVYSGGSNVIGGTGAGEGNLISGNRHNGVELASSGNRMLGNRIGVDVTGTAALGNEWSGIGAYDSTDDVIGGLMPGSGNLISGNASAGVFGSRAHRIRIQGNRIGTNEAGNSALGNEEGVILMWANDAVVGGPGTAEGNVVSGNASYGVRIDDASGVRVAGNLIGTSASGTAPIPNAYYGVGMINGAHDNVIGGTAAEANTIAFNRRGGVLVGTEDVRNAILSNRIHSNERVDSNDGLGIELWPWGVNANDPGDVDTGANDKLNFPVIAFASDSGSATTVAGSVDVGVAEQEVRIQLFRNDACDPSGHGEGQIWVGDWTGTTGPDGTASFVTTLPGGLRPGFLTATTFLPSVHATSEFSACVLIAAPHVVLDTFDAGGTFDGSQATSVAGGSWDPVGYVWFRSAVRFTVSGPDARVLSVTLPLSFSGITPGTLRVSVTEDGGGYPGTTLEVLSEDEPGWPPDAVPFGAATTLASRGYPLLRSGSNYWLVTELSRPPSEYSTYVQYRWSHGSSGPGLWRLLASQPDSSQPSWSSGTGSSVPLALRVEGVVVP